MDALISSSYAAASIASQRQDRVQSLILEAGKDPTVDTITAAKEAETQSTAAVMALSKALDVTRQSGQELANMLAQQSGVGTGLDTYA